MHEFNFWHSIPTILIVWGVLSGTSGFLVFIERKVCAFMQQRYGPNRVGPQGLLQLVADGLKFLLKEETLPARGDKILFVIAPIITLLTAFVAFTVVPFGAVEPLPLRSDYTSMAEYQTKLEAYRTSYQCVIAPNVDIGILLIFAVTSLAVYGIILGGWASNNKYSMLGALRSSAQVISYEIPLVLSVLGVVLLTGSLNLERIIWHQAVTSGIWNIFLQPVAFFIFMVSSFAECNRLPFDLPETEQELIGGYHTEYNGMKLAFFFQAEYTHMITTSFLMVILFFGGWEAPWIAEAGSPWIVKFVVFSAKVTLFILFYMFVRWTIPRLRYDQLMGLAWKVLIPLALMNLLCTMVVKEMNWSVWLVPVLTLGGVLGAAGLAALPSGGIKEIGLSAVPRR